MNIRWLEITRVYNQWDDRDKESSASEYTDEPVLQYFDEETVKWINIPTVEQRKIMQ